MHSTVRRLQFAAAAILFFPIIILAQDSVRVIPGPPSLYLSIQYLGLTYHPDGGNTPEIYPMKLDRKAYLVLDVGFIIKLDWRMNDYSFFRFAGALYKDCAFVTAGGFHLGPRLQYSWGENQVNAGIGPILSFRQDWHRFAEYRDDEFYGKRVYKGWQYRLFPTALEFEYLRRISKSIQLQYSVIPGAPLVITSLIGIRYSL
jgi:hypothetical protein